MQLAKFSQELTMTSREIADLLEKQHSNLKVSAERLAEKGVIGTLAAHEFTHNGNIYVEYILNKRDSLILVAQNCPEFTARIIDRWQELEAAQKPALPDFTNPVEAARAWADAKEAEQKALIALEEAKPAVEFVSHYVERSSLQNATQVAQTFKMSAVAMNKHLDNVGGVYNKSVKRGRTFCQSWVDDGNGEMKQTEMGYPQALFTTKGALRVHEIFTSEGII